ncbi:tyrosine-type recombinase/integrase [Mesorhizobium sp.]|uniref:tyrosine-type recombinase/integrase n=1 Tax=Mesorhizobium sp. TaxID=1871066 RepID=UPI000FE71FD3|nr:tyrosine-type recombinase/integrase [Mesorhizobium sp.]RWO26668.1 MAG: integrase [Mesorhizobium sp.]
MMLREVVEQYIAWRQTHGAKFKTGGRLLRLFLKNVDGNAHCDAVSRAHILAFLAGNGPLTRHRENKYCTLNGFYRYAVSRGHASRSPMPDNEPRPPKSAPPHIYSPEELKRLFDPGTMKLTKRRRGHLDAVTFRTLLFLLYGAGLRLGEASRLAVTDVDLTQRLLTIHDAKSFKSRLVPIGRDLARVLKSYMSARATFPVEQTRSSFFLATRTGAPLAPSTVQAAFDRLRLSVGINGGTATRRPRLHDLRHTFAVHRLTDWYRQGEDVQRLLPVLSTYLGHTDLEGTKVYLPMTPELLQQASSRFAGYAMGGGNA